MIRVNSFHLPLVVIDYDGVLTMADLTDSLAEFDRLLERRQRYVSISDISRLSTPGPDLLRRQARWYGERKDAMRELCVASATVAPSAIARGLLKALSWLQPLPQPQATVATFKEAFTFVERKLKEENLELPASAAELHVPRQRAG